MITVNNHKQGFCQIKANKSSYLKSNENYCSMLSSLKIKDLNSDKVCFTNNEVTKPERLSIKSLFDGSSVTNCPFILVHGTVLSKESISKVDEYLTLNKLKSNCTRYPSITSGQKLEISALEVSKNINKERIKLTQSNLDKLNPIINSKKELIKYFNIDYNSKYKNYDINNLLNLLPDCIKEVNNIIENNSLKELQNTFSTRIKLLEKDLSNQLLKTDFGNWNKKLQNKLCKKAASEIINSISPKAILIGHSMGGFVNYTIALNPKQDLEDKDVFKYDGGNGINAVLILAAPVNNGITFPLPETYSGLIYDLINETYIEPVEKGLKNCGLINRFTEQVTNFWKTLYKSTIKTYANISALYLNNFIYQKSPGYEQISENSNFVKDYIKNKKIPDGITAISFYHELDGISEPHKSQLNENFNNNHNVKVDIEIKKKDLDKAKTENPQMTLSHHAHRVIATEPSKCLKALQKEPSNDIKMLDIDNYEGLRYIYLKNIEEKIKKDPNYLNNNQALINSIIELTKEQLPFVNSASRLALRLNSGY